MFFSTFWWWKFWHENPMEKKYRGTIINWNIFISFPWERETRLFVLQILEFRDGNQMEARLFFDNPFSTDRYGLNREIYRNRCSRYSLRGDSTMEFSPTGKMWDGKRYCGSRGLFTGIRTAFFDDARSASPSLLKQSF